METVLTIDREADGKLVISQSKNYITNTSISLSDKEIEEICSVYKRINTMENIQKTFSNIYVTCVMSQQQGLKAETGQLNIRCQGSYIVMLQES